MGLERSNRLSTVIVVPWYEEADFAELVRLASDEPRLPTDFESWKRAATAATERLLAKGHAIQLITLRARDYTAWLDRTGRSNSRQARLRFLMAEAAKAGGDVAILRGKAEQSPDASRSY